MKSFFFAKKEKKFGKNENVSDKKNKKNERFFISFS
jgi:hypothetical protein